MTTEERGTGDSGTLLVIDGHSLAFRAFYALPAESFRTATGLYTNAVHGFLQMMLSLLEQEKPTHMAVAFDLSRHSFRTDLYPEYKGTRGETPPEFLGQVESLQKALGAMRIRTLTKPGFEADDILATVSAWGDAAGMRVFVVSGDRDAIQLVDSHVTLLYPVRGVHVLTHFDPRAVEEKYGVSPERYPDVAALVGETSDNLPGVPSVGPKTAARWVTQYGGLAGVLAHRDEIRGRAGESLRGHVSDVERNRRLNALVRDVDLGVGLGDLRLTTIDRPAVDRVFGELELRTVGARVRRLGEGLQPGEASPGDGHRVDSGASGGAPAPAFPPDHDGVAAVDEDTAEVVDDVAPDARRLEMAECVRWVESQEGPVGVTIDLSDDAVQWGLASATEAVEASGPLSGAGGFAAWLASDAPKVVFDAKSTLESCWRVGWDVRGIVGDALLTWYVTDSARSDFTLEAATQRYFTQPLSVDDSSQLLPETDPVSPGVRAWYVLRLHLLLRRRLPEDGGGRVLDGIEVPLSRVLAQMESAGVAVDADRLRALSDELGSRMASIAQDAFRTIGHEVNLASPKQLQQVLFEELGMPRTRRTKTGFSTDAEALADLVVSTDHPFPLLLLQHRDAAKLRQMVETLVHAVGSDGRIHTRYVQTGAATGRLSSADPNLQNIPVKTDEGKRIRACFVAADGYRDLLTADYSQVEMRIMAHMSGDEGLIEAFRSGEDLHRYVGAKVFGVSPSEVTPAMRSKVKAMSYGLVYGLSSFGLSRQLRIPRREAQELMDEYFRRFGGVRDYLHAVVEKARIDGYTQTLFGRRRYFPDLRSSRRAVRDNAERAALNAPIQGTAADIMKIAMLGVDTRMREAGLRSRMLLQVHDELIFEVAEGEHQALESIAVGEMSGAAKLDVPLEVQVGFGKDWNEAAH